MSCLPTSSHCSFLHSDPFLLPQQIKSYKAYTCSLVYQESNLLRNCSRSSAVGKPLITHVLWAPGTSDFRLPCVPSTSNSHARIYKLFPVTAYQVETLFSATKKTREWFLVFSSQTLSSTAHNQNGMFSFLFGNALSFFLIVQWLITPRNRNATSYIYG